MKAQYSAFLTPSQGNDAQASSNNHIKLIEMNILLTFLECVSLFHSPLSLLFTE